MGWKSWLTSDRPPPVDRDAVIEAVLVGVLHRHLEAAEKAQYLELLPADAPVLEQVKILLAHLNPFPAPRFVPPGHHYSPITRVDEVDPYLRQIESQPIASTVSGLAVDRDAMISLWNDLLPHFRNMPFSGEARPGLRYRLDNPAYSWGDGSVLHAMIAHVKPRRIIEVGSGWSTVCTLDTIDSRLDRRCDFTVIEPFPELMWQLVASGSAPSRVIPSQIQQVPLETFDELEENDILFIDSTHVVRTGSDVCHEVFEVLPRLKPGVLVHFHDIFWPFEYPRMWAVEQNRSWSEIYLLRALLTGSTEWEIVMFNDFLAKLARPEIERSFPDFMRNSGGALWLRKRANPASSQSSSVTTVPA